MGRFKIVRIRERVRWMMAWSVAVLVLITAVAIYFVAQKLINRVSEDYATMYSNEIVSEVYAHINREIALTQSAANNDVIKAWMKDPGNPEKRNQAGAAFMTMNNTLVSNSSFCAVDATLDYYYLDSKMGYDLAQPVGQLRRDLSDDAWYFKTVEGSAPYMLNIDTDRYVNTLRIWVNMKVLDGNRVLGALGTGVYLEDFTEHIFANYAKNGVRSVVINHFGAIQLDADNENISENSFEKSKDVEKTIAGIVKDAAFNAELNRYLMQGDEKKVYRLKDSRYQYAAVEAIEDTEWHVVTFFDSKSLFTIADLLPIIGIMSSVAFVMLMVLGFIIQKVFMEPFEALKRSIHLKEDARELMLYGMDRQDEFGDMARTIEQMSRQLVESIPVGLFMMDRDGRFTYCNDYFLRQFACASTERFNLVLKTSPETYFRETSVYEDLLRRLAEKPELIVFEEEFVNHQGKPFWAEVRITLIQDSETQWEYEGILLNIQKKKEEEGRLMELASRDKLTGIYNRRYFDEFVVEEIGRSERYGMPLSMAIFDLDHFKHVNDTYGHPVGDKVLVQTVAIVKYCMRQSDVLARWGGEEFVILMPETDLIGGQHAAERIRRELEKYSHEQVGRVTASFGVSSLAFYEPLEQWVRRVDEALYSAKEQGRNRVVAMEAPVDQNANLFASLWSDSMLSGNEIIDRQHKALFELADGLIRADIEGQERKTVFAIMEGIIVDFGRHCKDEEAVIIACGCPKELVEEHQDHHQQMTAVLEELAKSYAKDETPVNHIFISLIKNVIVDHLMKEDRKYFGYLHSGEAAERME